jgi:erythritol kinase
MTALAIDVGTSMIKTVAFDDEGHEIALARQETRVLRPKPGYAEQDMNEVWNAVVHTLRTARQDVGGDVQMVALTAQGDGCWLVDEQGEPTGNAALRSDGRNPGLIEKWEQDGTIEKAFRINGSLSFPGLPNAILPHMREHEPDRVERAHKALYCGGWVFFKLTGELAIDESDASCPLLDIRARRWSPEVLKLYDLEWAEHLLPDVRAMDGRVGTLTEPAATETGLLAGLPVVLAPYDIVSTAIGVGAVAPGQACSILGTTLCTEVMVDRADTDGEPSGFHIAMGVSDRYIRVYPTLAGTEVIRRAMELLRLDDPAQLSELAGKAAAGRSGLVFLPYLSPAGERAPFLNPAARGTFIGLTLEHHREQVALAVLEGLTLVLRDCLEASKAQPTELRVCGGGAASDFWCQLIADVTGVTTFRSADTELGAKGAFLTGLVATGKEDDFEHAVTRFVRLRDQFEPQADRADAYAERYRLFLDLRDVCAAAWQKMARAAAGVEKVHV